MSDTLLELDEVTKHFRVRGRNPGTVHAVNGVTLQVGTNEVVGIVGESGCGKSTLGRLIVGLEHPTSGRVTVHGEPLRKPGANGKLQMVFQDPAASLNPRMTTQDTVLEPIRTRLDGREARNLAGDLLTSVGMPVSSLDRYPHQFSGGQQQRVALARALSSNPDLIVLDESVSALDVSTQAQVLNLLKDLQERMSVSFVFISHDLAAVRFLSDRIFVMYLGEIMEQAPVERFYSTAAHPYSVALQSAVPTLDAGSAARERVVLEGPVPSPMDPPSGCPFHTRCPIAESRCIDEKPVLAEHGSVLHAAACHYPGEFVPGANSRLSQGA